MSFWYLQFSQNTNEKNWLYYYGTSSRIVLVRLLAELKTSKRHFEINWRLQVVLNQVYSKNDYVVLTYFNSNYFIFICSISFEWYDHSSSFRRNLPSGSGQHATRGRDHTPIGNWSPRRFRRKCFSINRYTIATGKWSNNR